MLRPRVIGFAFHGINISQGQQEYIGIFIGLNRLRRAKIWVWPQRNRLIIPQGTRILENCHFWVYTKYIRLDPYYNSHVFRSSAGTLTQSLILTHLFLRSIFDLRSFQLLLSIPPFNKYSRLYSLRLSIPERRSTPERLPCNMFQAPSKTIGKWPSITQSVTYHTLYFNNPFFWKYGFDVLYADLPSLNLMEIAKFRHNK